MSWARTSIWSHIGELFLAFDFLSVLRGSFDFFISATTANDLRLRRISIQDLIHYICFFYFKLYLYYNDYETSYTTYINHARWSTPMFAFEWSSCRRKPEYPGETHLSDLLTTWPSDMPTQGIEPRSQRWEASQPYWWSWHLLYSNELLRRVRGLIHKYWESRPELTDEMQ